MSELYQHQESGAQAIANSPTGRLYLGDECGIGKTRTEIRALELVGSKRPLVICPAIARSQWSREFDSLHWHEHGQRPVIKSFEEIVIGGNELMRHLFLDYKIDALRIDEGHYCKHATAKRTLQILGQDGYARRLRHVSPSSGTPIPKNPLEFRVMLTSLWPEVALAHGLKTEADYVDRFCVQRGMLVRGQWRLKTLAELKNADEFKAILGQVMIARSLDDVGLDVPKIFWQVLWLDIDAKGSVPLDESGALRPALEAGDLESIADDPHIARMRRRLGELKAPLVGDLLFEQLLDGDEKIVVFAHHQNVLDSLHARLAAFGVARIDGNTSPGKRELAKRRFIYGEDRVFLGQNIACQTALDGLQRAAKRAVMVEPDWTGTVNWQLGKRLARIGQDGDRVIVQMVALANTIDGAIVRQNVKETRLVAELGLGQETVMT